MEVLYDLDDEAAAAADEAGLNFVRARHRGNASEIYRNDSRAGRRTHRRSPAAADWPLWPTPERMRDRLLQIRTAPTDADGAAVVAQCCARWENSTLRVSPVALGCWPITGMTSIDVNEADSLATIAAAVDAGINFLDTAYFYGPNGESETDDRPCGRAPARRTGDRDEGRHSLGRKARSPVRRAGPTPSLANAKRACSGCSTDRVEAVTTCTRPIRKFPSPNRPARSRD